MKALNLASKIFLNIFVIIYGLTSVGSEIALANAGAITAFLGQSTQQIINDGESEAIIKNFSDFTSIKDLKEAANEVTAQVTEEGAVLLKNDNNALPLSAGAKVNADNIFRTHIKSKVDGEVVAVTAINIFFAADFLRFHGRINR